MFCAISAQVHFTQAELLIMPSGLLSHYQRLLAMQPLRPSDWLNAGHAALATGHTSQAIGYYRHSQATSLTESDRSLLLSLSVSPLIVNLVTDLLEKEVGK